MWTFLWISVFTIYIPRTVHILDPKTVLFLFLEKVWKANKVEFWGIPVNCKK